MSGNKSSLTLWARQEKLLAPHWVERFLDDSAAALPAVAQLCGGVISLNRMLDFNVGAYLEDDKGIAEAVGVCRQQVLCLAQVDAEACDVEGFDLGGRDAGATGWALGEMRPLGG